MVASLDRDHWLQPGTQVLHQDQDAEAEAEEALIPTYRNLGAFGRGLQVSEVLLACKSIQLGCVACIETE
jgi:hypothetical protein